MRILRIIMSYMLILILPVMALCATNNLILRAPDVYQYSFKATEVIEKQSIGITGDEMGSFISKYMLHMSDKDEFQLSVDGDDEAGLLVFSKSDQRAVESLRDIADIMAVIGIVSLLLAVVCYACFIKMDLKYILRVRFNGAIAVFAIMVAVALMVYFIPSTAQWVANLIFSGTFSETDMIPLLLNRHFATAYLIIGISAATLIMILMGYVTWRLTKPKRMFW